MGRREEDRFPILAAELVRMNVDIIVATNSRAARAVRQLTKNDPYRHDSTYPVGARACEQPTRTPDGNITGLYLYVPAS